MPQHHSIAWLNALKNVPSHAHVFRREVLSRGLTKGDMFIFPYSPVYCAKEPLCVRCFQRRMKATTHTASSAVDKDAPRSYFVFALTLELVRSHCVFCIWLFIHVPLLCSFFVFEFHSLVAAFTFTALLRWHSHLFGFFFFFTFAPA